MSFSNSQTNCGLMAESRKAISFEAHNSPLGNFSLPDEAIDIVPERRNIDYSESALHVGETMSESKRTQVDELTLLRAWSDWNSKSRIDYLEAILRLTVEERRIDRGASWGSIQDIFLHVLEDYIWWFENVPQGRGEDEFVALLGRDTSENELRTLVQRVDNLIHKFMDSLTSEDLGHPYVVHGTSGSGKTYTMTTCPADIVWHMVEEQLQHFGELNALFWQLDVDPPVHAWFSSELAWTH